VRVRLPQGYAVAGANREYELQTGNVVELRGVLDRDLDFILYFKELVQ